MYIYNVNRGGIITIKTLIVSAKHLNGRGFVHHPDAGVASTCYARSNGHLCIEPSWERGRPGLVPFVSDRPGAYGRLLLTVYVRWRTGLLVSSDWLRPVTRDD